MGQGLDLGYWGSESIWPNCSEAWTLQCSGLSTTHGHVPPGTESTLLPELPGQLFPSLCWGGWWVTLGFGIFRVGVSLPDGGMGGGGGQQPVSGPLVLVLPFY